MTIRSILKGSLLAAVAFAGVSGGQSSAANGSIDREDRVVYINGDDYHDLCEITVDGDEIEIELIVHDANGDVDDIDDADYDLDDVDLIVFQGFGGSDFFYNYTSVPCTAMGGPGVDVLWGGSGDDNLYGGPDSDWLYGEEGDDDLFGEGGMDGLFGGDDNDYLKAGTGEDEYYILGQDGNDIFATPATLSSWTRRFVPLNRNVFFEDFDPNEDTEILFWAPVVFTFARTVSFP